LNKEITALICGLKISNKIVESQTADNQGVEVGKENCFGQSKNGRDPGGDVGRTSFQDTFNNKTGYLVITHTQELLEYHLSMFPKQRGRGCWFILASG